MKRKKQLIVSLSPLVQVLILFKLKILMWKLLMWRWKLMCPPISNSCLRLCEDRCKHVDELDTCQKKVWPQGLFCFSDCNRLKRV